MNCCVVIPVGPGHEKLAEAAENSARAAWDLRDKTAWNTMRVELYDDRYGHAGRSHARNTGILLHRTADWYYLLDADDRAGPKTFSSFDPATTLGAVYGWPSFHTQDGTIRRVKDGPRGWQAVLDRGPLESLTMGCFFHGPSLREHLFREDLDHGEDWEMHLSFGAKYPLRVVQNTLCWVGIDQPSAGGPRGGERDWAKASEPFFNYWRKRGRKPLTTEERAARYWQ